jgi:hypothetical protein
MKESIDKGEWDTIVSDEAGGRIPTLLFLEIFRLVHPKSGTLRNLFVRGGRFTGSPTDEELDKYRAGFSSYVRAGLKEAKKVLFVTQYTADGSVSSLATRIRKIVPNIQSHDIATVQYYDLGGSGQARHEGAKHFFVGEDLPIFVSDRKSSLEHFHNIASGVYKSQKILHHPMRLDHALEQGIASRTELLDSKDVDILNVNDLKPPPFDKDATERANRDAYSAWKQREDKREEKYERDEITYRALERARSADPYPRGRTEEDYLNELGAHTDRQTERKKELDAIPLSDDERATIQVNIGLTREHIKKLAKEIYDEVWGDSIPVSDKDQR